MKSGATEWIPMANRPSSGAQRPNSARACRFRSKSSIQTLRTAPDSARSAGALAAEVVVDTEKTHVQIDALGLLERL